MKAYRLPARVEDSTPAFVTFVLLVALAVVGVIHTWSIP